MVFFNVIIQEKFKTYLHYVKQQENFATDLNLLMLCQSEVISVLTLDVNQNKSVTKAYFKNKMSAETT